MKILDRLKETPRQVFVLVIAVALSFAAGFCTRGAVGPTLAQVLCGKQVVEFKDGSSLWFYSQRPANVAIHSENWGDFGINAGVSTPTQVISIRSRSRTLPPEPVYFPRNP